eukprot:Lithocolla_globosa_v1_NODE_218_length_5069_cov_37.778620.p1 type:complete len:764 gc:universal NODE_218_length_5069_cov_37.778620:2423-132(-)
MGYGRLQHPAWQQPVAGWTLRCEADPLRPLRGAGLVLGTGWPVLLNRSMPDPRTTHKGSSLDFIYVSDDLLPMIDNPPVATVTTPSLSKHLPVTARLSSLLPRSPPRPRRPPLSLRRLVDGATPAQLASLSEAIDADLFATVPAPTITAECASLTSSFATNIRSTLPPQRDPRYDEMRSLVEERSVVREEGEPLFGRTCVLIHRRIRELHRSIECERFAARLERTAPLRDGGFTRQPATAPDIHALLVDERPCDSADIRFVPASDRPAYVREYYRTMARVSASDDPLFRRDELFDEQLSEELQRLRLQALWFVDPVDGGDISEAEIERAILKLRKHAAGPDKIPPSLMHVLGPGARGRIRSLFNRCLRTTDVPDQWLLGEICAITKPGEDSCRLSGTRPLTMTDALSKVFELIFKERFERDILGCTPDLQGGFRPHVGPDDQMYVLLRSIEYRRSRGLPVFACFLDIRRAFDSVPHRSLFAALWRDGLTGAPWLLFQRWYDGFCSSVRLGGGELTDPFQVLAGTRQGSILSPLFFLSFMNCLVHALVDSGIGLTILEDTLPALLVADDVVLLADSEHHLQLLLDVASQFSSRWGVCFHLHPSGKKTCAVVFPPDGLSIQHPAVWLSGVRVPVGSRYRYLGFHLDGRPGQLLDFGLSSRFSSARGAADRVLAELPEGSSSRLRFDSYCIRVRSVLEYVLASLPLSQDQERELDRVEKDLLNRMRCGDWATESVSARVRRQADSLRQRCRRAPVGTWRHRLAMIA